TAFEPGGDAITHVARALAVVRPKVEPKLGAALHGLVPVLGLELLQRMPFPGAPVHLDDVRLRGAGEAKQPRSLRRPAQRAHATVIACELRRHPPARGGGAAGFAQRPIGLALQTLVRVPFGRGVADQRDWDHAARRRAALVSTPSMMRLAATSE